MLPCNDKYGTHEWILRPLFLRSGALTHDRVSLGRPRPLLRAHLDEVQWIFGSYLWAKRHPNCKRPKDSRQLEVQSREKVWQAPCVPRDPIQSSRRGSRSSRLLVQCPQPQLHLNSHFEWLLAHNKFIRQCKDWRLRKFNRNWVFDAFEQEEFVLEHEGRSQRETCIHFLLLGNLEHCHRSRASADLTPIKHRWYLQPLPFPHWKPLLAYRYLWRPWSFLRRQEV